MVGFLEYLCSERAIAARGWDSLMIRRLGEPKHRRSLLGLCEAPRRGCWCGWAGRRSCPAFRQAAAGPQDEQPEWVNPNDRDAKVAQAKDGATDMLYKPENIVDLDTGAIVAAEFRKADEADTEGFVQRTIAAASLVEVIREESIAWGREHVSTGTGTVTADKGYYCVAELQAIQLCKIETVISDPLRNRRIDKLDAPQQAVVRNARSSASSEHGKALLRLRGMRIERSFAHIYQRRGSASHCQWELARKAESIWFSRRKMKMSSFSANAGILPMWA